MSLCSALLSSVKNRHRCCSDHPGAVPQAPRMHRHLHELRLHEPPDVRDGVREVVHEMLPQGQGLDHRATQGSMTTHSLPSFACAWLLLFRRCSLLLFKGARLVFSPVCDADADACKRLQHSVFHGSQPWAKVPFDSALGSVMSDSCNIFEIYILACKHLGCLECLPLHFILSAAYCRSHRQL